MKKLGMILVLVLMVVFTGCSSLASKAEKKFTAEVKSFDIIAIEREEDNLKIWKRKDSDLIFYSQGDDIHGAMTPEKFLRTVVEVLAE